LEPLSRARRRKKWSRYPPGPASLPFIGTMFSIDFHNPHRSFGQVSGKRFPPATCTAWGLALKGRRLGSSPQCREAPSGN
uniref:Uncharacterized protein n=1 Tax=Zonotrichia albicollis TaxID=44394 RepID=A0A8D2QC37_ZONAL